MGNPLTNKAASLEHCIRRIREEYTDSEDSFATNVTKQDSIVLNLERSCQICIDMALLVIKSQHWGLPQSNRDAFAILALLRNTPSAPFSFSLCSSATRH